jgi:hypothetical protein
MSWSLKGTYFESCNCDAVCPCIFLSAPTMGECTVVLGWHIEHGNDEGVSLDGLNVALAVHAPGKMHEVKWNAAAYVDERANDAQRQSLLRIFGGQAGGHPAVLAGLIGKLLGAKFVPITFDSRGKQFALRIPAIADVEIEAIGGAGGADAQVSGHPLCVAPGFPATVARSKHLRYTDYEYRWSLADKNGLFSPFQYQN